jgi:hypothetical protein
LVEVLAPAAARYVQHYDLTRLENTFIICRQILPIFVAGDGGRLGRVHESIAE